MNWNFQFEVHPDADQLSVFVEGAATSREHEQMLGHLAECAECRKAVFFMQPPEQTQAATRTPEKGWIWGRLLPVGLPAAALACGLVVLLVHIWPRDPALRNPQQVASLRKPEVSLPQTAFAPNAGSDKVQQSETPRSFAPPTNRSRQENLSLPKSLNLPESSVQAAAKVAAPETTTANLSANVPVAHAGGTGGGIGGAASELPLNGRNITNLQQLSTPADAKAAASQNSLAKKEDMPALEVERASGQAEAFAGVSGRITDPSGATISGARVSLRDAAGKTRQTTTSADGSFHLTELPAGRYELMATASGFKTIEQSIQLNPSQFAMLQPVLDVGTASEAVTVEAATAAAQVQTESSNVNQTVGGQVLAEMPSVDRAAAELSGLPVAARVSHGKRFLSLDSTGNLFLSRNGGKKWKKINPQWTGKAVHVESTPAYSSEAPPKPKNETLGKASEVAIFLLTTDAGTVWTSRDGAHWHQQ